MALLPNRLYPELTKIWSRFDRLYLYCGYLSAFFLVCIFAATLLQIVGRLIGYNPHGLTDYVGYFMAASAFLAMAHALNRGAHVRLELFLAMMGRFRIVAEWFAFAATTAIAVWLTYYAWAQVYWSFELGDISQGLDATPMWIPQSAMAVGVTILAICVADHSLRLVLTGHHQVGTPSASL